MKLIIVSILITSITAFAQIKNTTPFFYFVPEYSKNDVLIHSKSALLNFLGVNEIGVKVEIYPIAGNGGNEVSALLYKCTEKQQRGIMLGFYGRNLTVSGQPYTGFAFRTFNLNQSREFLNKIDEEFNKNSKYLKNDANNNNIFFRYEDINVIITNYSIRLLWQNFDSSWNKNLFDETKKEYEKK